MVTKISEARSRHAMRGERRTVTMLFADIQGSTAAAEGLDPEDWADIINGAFEHLIAPVYRYEGTLARLQGDAVLAFFGAPIAHEDDPVRAVRAGLEIIEAMQPYSSETLKRWEVPVNVRVGINTGLVVVGEVGSDLKVEYTALGDAVNVAARMEQTAEPGTVRVTGQTWSLVSDHFEGEELGPVEVKGKSEPVVALRVLGLKGPVERATEQLVLIGRSDELDRLDELRSRVVGGTGWLTSIIGDAGVGKTRLLQEFRTRTAASQPTAFSFDEDGDVAWMSAFCQSYDSSVPYATIRDLLVRWWRLDQAADPYQRVEQVVDSAPLNGQPDAAAYLGHVSGTPLSESASDLLDKLEPPVLQNRVRQAVITYLATEASRRPLLIALEDIHWADAMSVALIEDLMDLAEKEPLGLVFSMRAYRDEPTWRIHEVAQRDHPHRYVPVDLVSLGVDATEKLVDGLLEGVNVPEATRRKILKRSDGNPLFIAQMAHAIRDTGTAVEVQVPTGLTSLLTARLDRLDEESRMVTQMASVVGSEFDRHALAALVGDHVDLDRPLTDLLRREIFVEQADTPGMLGFYHALMQDAAYSTMLLRTRRELHARVAEYLTSAQPDAVEEMARHFVEAGDMEAAFPHLVAAGEKTSRAMALSESIRFFTTALDGIPSGVDSELVVRAHDGLGVAYSLVPDLTQTEAAYQRLLDYADSTGRPSDKVKALNRLALNTATISGDLDAASRYLDDAYTIATEFGDDFGLAEYHLNACSIAGIRGDLQSSAHHDEEAIKSGQNLGSDEIRLAGMSNLAENTTWLTDYERAVPAVEEAIEAAREAGDEWTLARVNAMALAQLRLRDGDTEGALRLLLDNEETLIRYGDFEAPIVQSLAGTLLFDRGDIETGIRRIVDVRTVAMEGKAPFYIALASAGLARAYAWLHIVEPLAELRASALESMEAAMGGFMASTVWADLGYANLGVGNFAEAARDFATGREVSSITQYWERPRLLVGRALALTQLGEYGDAHRCIDEAQSFVLEKEMRLYDAHVAHARGEVLLAEGRIEEASAKLDEAMDAASLAGLRLLAVQIALSAAREATTAGDARAAGNYAARARAEVVSMALSIVDDDLRIALETVWLTPLSGIAIG